jgi:hypothetical protein
VLSVTDNDRVTHRISFQGSWTFLFPANYIIVLDKPLMKFLAVCCRLFIVDDFSYLQYVVWMGRDELEKIRESVIYDDEK